MSEYKELAQSFLDMPSRPDLYIAVVPPVLTAKGVAAQADMVNEQTAALIPKIGQELGLSADRVIDVFKRLGGRELSRPEYFCDGRFCDHVHLNDAGYSAIAAEVYK